jgi:hypothetical protein
MSDAKPTKLMAIDFMGYMFTKSYFKNNWLAVKN